MPRVPGAPGPSAGLNGGPGAQFQAPQVAPIDAQLNTPQLRTPQFSTPQLHADLMRPAQGDPSAIKRVTLSDRGASQWGAMGSALGTAADALNHSVMAYQTKVNAAVVDDALNQARDAAARLTYGHKDEATGNVVGGYRNLTGADAIRRPDGQSLDDEVTGQFKEVLNKISADKLTNQDQQRAFAMQANDIGSGLRQGALVHQAEQFDSYYQGVYTAQVQNLTTAFATQDPGDLAGQKKVMDQIEQAVGTLAVHKGASAEELQVGLRGARSAAVNGLFEQAMTAKKYTTAQALLNQWSGQIDPNAAAKMKSMLDGHVALQVGEQLADQAWTHWGAPHFQAGDADRGFNITLQTEHHGATPRQFDGNGKTITSPVGAYGVAQLMPGTAEDMAKKLGRPELADLAKQPTKAGEAANRLLGRTYFNGLVTQFNGDMEKAFAAYNAGPGALIGGKDRKGNKIEGALKQAAATGGDWRTFLPKETQDYVASAMKSWGSGEGAPAKPSREQLTAQIDAQTDDPDVRRAAYSKLDRHFSNAEADERQSNEDAYAEGVRVVRESGGNLNAIAPELKARIKPEQFSTLQSYAKNTVDGQYTVTKPEAYYVAMNPTSLKAMNMNQLEAMRPDLSEEDFKTARNLWQDVHAPQPGKGPDSLDVGAVDSILKTRLQYMGINVTPKKGDLKSEARLGAIYQFAHQYVLDQQRQSGVKFTDYADLEKSINTLFLRNQGFKNTVAGFTTSHGQQNVITAGVKDIPADTLKPLQSTLQKHLGRKPTDAETLQAYFRSQFYGG